MLKNVVFKQNKVTFKHGLALFFSVAQSDKWFRNLIAWKMFLNALL